MLSYHYISVSSNFRSIPILLYTYSYWKTNSKLVSLPISLLSPLSQYPLLLNSESGVQRQFSSKYLSQEFCIPLPHLGNFSLGLGIKGFSWKVLAIIEIIIVKKSRERKRMSKCD